MTRRNTSAKGARIERLAIGILEAQGFLVHRAVRTPVLRDGQIRGSNSNDIFGVADIVAIKPKSLVRFVQCGMPQHRSDKRKKMEPVARHADADCARFEVWSFHEGRKPKGQRFDVQCWNGFEYVECADEVCA